MKFRAVSILLLLATAPGLVVAEEAADASAWIARSRSLANRLGGELKAELGKALQTGGPVAAIEVCRTRAPEIAARLSNESGATVGRTALRVRNPSNAPDALESAVLAQFRDELASGRFEGPLEAAFEINRGGQVERRYLRAIPTDAVCLTCHGAALAPEIAAAIERGYPSDAATGFDLGELRGAFSVAWPATAVPSSAP
jgi:hypothetical protein